MKTVKAWEFISPNVDLDGEEDNIFLPEGSFSGVCNTFVNQ